MELQSLSTFRLSELTSEFIEVAGDHYSPLNATRFLCGISSPLLTKLHAKKLAHFGFLERYPFLDVNAWVNHD